MSIKPGNGLFLASLTASQAVFFAATTLAHARRLFSCNNNTAVSFLPFFERGKIGLKYIKEGARVRSVYYHEGQIPALYL
jgi:hypothetical protein